jgi:glycosyltransferase involved in cell wall biosynthesis
MQPVLSICICALQSRIGMLGALRRELESQIERCNAQELVEVIINMDNKEKSTGKKRQELLEQAKGEYIVYIDDDDWVSDDYVCEVLKGCRSKCDVIAIFGWIETDGKNRINWETSAWYDNKTIVDNGKSKYIRTVNHICPSRIELAIQAGFNDVSNGEDKFYSDRLKKLVFTQYTIGKHLYFYRFKSTEKEY